MPYHVKELFLVYAHVPGNYKNKFRKKFEHHFVIIWKTEKTKSVYMNIYDYIYISLQSLVPVELMVRAYHTLALSSCGDIYCP